MLSCCLKFVGAKESPVRRNPNWTFIFYNDLEDRDKLYFRRTFVSLVNGIATVSLKGINPDTSVVSIFNNHGSNDFFFIRIDLSTDSFTAHSNKTSLNGQVAVIILYKF